MTLTFYWEPELSFILYVALSIFRYVTLIVFANSRKKAGFRSKDINNLLVLGIILINYNIISFFLPSLNQVQTAGIMP